TGMLLFFFSSRRRHTRFSRDWSSDVCSSDLVPLTDLDEQRKFVSAMRESRHSTNRLRAAITKQLALLAERRQALITAAVTGQFDVSTASGRNTIQGV